mmetsp:Transcript_48413/g.85287  ORF Transcript_48413/g.85287 Transcript_48413/m.85287 type:complete len:425 (+) Transcript_48413:102-1376(+)
MEGKQHTKPQRIQLFSASRARECKGISGKLDATRGTVSSALRKASGDSLSVCERCLRRSGSAVARDKVGARCECVSVASLIARYETAGSLKSKAGVARPMAQRPRGKQRFKMPCSKSPSASKVRQVAERSPKGRSQIVGLGRIANTSMPTSKVQTSSRLTGVNASSSAKKDSPCACPITSATSDSITDTALQKCEHLLEQLEQTVGVDASRLPKKDGPQSLTRMYLHSTSQSIADAALQKSQLLLEQLDHLGFLQDAEFNALDKNVSTPKPKEDSRSISDTSSAAIEALDDEELEDLDSAVIADLQTILADMREEQQLLRSKDAVSALPTDSPVPPLMSPTTCREGKTLLGTGPAWQCMSSRSVSTESGTTLGSTLRSLASTQTSSARSLGSFSIGSRHYVSREEERALAEVGNLPSSSFPWKS